MIEINGQTTTKVKYPIIAMNNSFDRLNAGSDGYASNPQKEKASQCVNTNEQM
jgi:uncharacterized membrane protein